MPKLKCSGEGTSLTNFQNVKNDPMGTNNFGFKDSYTNLTHVFSNIQVTENCQSYQEDIFNPKSSQKVQKRAKFRNI